MYDCPLTRSDVGTLLAGHLNLWGVSAHNRCSQGQRNAGRLTVDGAGAGGIANEPCHSAASAHVVPGGSGSESSCHYAEQQQFPSSDAGDASLPDAVNALLSLRNGVPFSPLPPCDPTPSQHTPSRSRCVSSTDTTPRHLAGLGLGALPPSPRQHAPHLAGCAGRPVLALHGAALHASPLWSGALAEGAADSEVPQTPLCGTSDVSEHAPLLLRGTSGECALSEYRANCSSAARDSAHASVVPVLALRPLEPARVPSSVPLFKPPSLSCLLPAVLSTVLSTPADARAATRAQASSACRQDSPAQRPCSRPSTPAAVHAAAELCSSAPAAGATGAAGSGIEGLRPRRERTTSAWTSNSASWLMTSSDTHEVRPTAQAAAAPASALVAPSCPPAYSAAAGSAKRTAVHGRPAGGKTAESTTAALTRLVGVPKPRCPPAVSEGCQLRCDDCGGYFAGLKAMARCSTCYQRYYRAQKRKRTRAEAPVFTAAELFAGSLTFGLSGSQAAPVCSGHPASSPAVRGGSEGESAGRGASGARHAASSEDGSANKCPRVASSSPPCQHTPPRASLQDGATQPEQQADASGGLPHWTKRPGVCSPSDARPDSQKRVKQVAQLVAEGRLSQGDSLFYMSRGQVQAHGRVWRDGILCMRCERVVGCTQFERCAGSALRRPCEHIFAADSTGRPGKRSLQDLLDLHVRRPLSAHGSCGAENPTLHHWELLQS